MSTDPRRKPASVAHRKPESVEFMRFYGWASALDIIQWLMEHDHKAYYVAEGYEHHLRLPREHDRANGHLNPSAAPFLAVYLGATWIRVDHSEILILDDSENLSVTTQSHFSTLFDTMEEVEEK